MLRRRLVVTMGCLASLVFLVAADEKAGESPMSEHKLVTIRKEEWKGDIVLRVGDMLQLQPFTYPVTPKFLDANVKIELTGDRVLESVGKTDASPNGEGRTGQSVFLYAQRQGMTTVTATLVGTDEKGIVGYRAVYKVTAK